MPVSFAPTFAKIKAAKSVPRSIPLPGGRLNCLVPHRRMDLHLTQLLSCLAN